MASNKNLYISYLKWVAMICIILTHLINWSNIDVISWSFLYYFRDFIKVGMLFFIALSGSLIIIAYDKYNDLKKISTRLIKRSIILLGVYFAYNILKLYIFDFQKEPYYWGYMENQTFNLDWILTFKSFSVPLTVLPLFSVLLAITPIFVYIHKRLKYQKFIILSILTFFVLLDYILIFPKIGFIKYLYWIDTVFYWINLWIIPFIIGIFLWIIWFEKKKKEILAIFWLLFGINLIYLFINNKSILIENYLYPLQIYHILASFFIMFLFVYLYDALKKINSKTIQLILEFINFLWDNSLNVYIWHRLVIDIAIWLFFPFVKVIWFIVPTSMIVYFILKKYSFFLK